MFSSAHFTVPLQNHKLPVFFPRNDNISYSAVCFNGKILKGMGNESVGSAALTTGVTKASYIHTVVAHRLSKGQGQKMNRPKLK